MDNETQAYSPWGPERTDEQKQADMAATQRLEASVPLLQDVLDWFDQRISTYRNPLVIEGVNPATDAETVKQAVLFAQTLITEYKQQKAQFTGQFGEYIKTKEERET